MVVQCGLTTVLGLKRPVLVGSGGGFSRSAVNSVIQHLA